MDNFQEAEFLVKRRFDANKLDFVYVVEFDAFDNEEGEYFAAEVYSRGQIATFETEEEAKAEADRLTALIPENRRP